MSAAAPNPSEHTPNQSYYQLALAAIVCLWLTQIVFGFNAPESFYVQSARFTAMLAFAAFYVGVRYVDRIARRPEPYALATDLTLTTFVCFGLHQTGFALEYSALAYLLLSITALTYTEVRLMLAYVALSAIAYITTSFGANDPKVSPLAFSLLILIHGLFTGTMVASTLRTRGRQLRTQTINTAMFEESMDGVIYGHTRTGNVVAANSRALEIFESNDMHQVGALTKEGFDRTFGDAAQQTLRQSLAAEGWRGTLSLRTAGGRMFWADVSFSRMKLATDDMVMVQIADVTERVQDQARLRETQLLLDRSQSMARVGGWQFSNESKKWAFTRSASHILHLPPGHDSLYRSLLLDRAETRRIIVDAFRNTLTTGQTFDMELNVQTWHNKPLLVRVLGEAIITNGKVVKVIGVFTDITERQERELELRKAKDAAEDAAKARSQFLANMSHEIRTPMNGVIGMASLLMESDLNADHKRLVGTINKSGEALLGIINEILDFSKIDAGEMQLEAMPFDPEALLQQTAELFTPLASRKELGFKAEIDHQLTGNQRLLGDEGRLRQILNNLLSNAIKFTETGTVTLTSRITLRNYTGGKRAHLSVNITDSGIGIEPNHIKHLFEPFAQADSSITRRYGGTGLGLSICKQLAELMGGRLEASSKLGSGSEFTLSLVLPIDQQHAVAAPNDAEVDVSALRDRVLLVEDNKVNQTVALKMLERLGINADLAENGREAIERLQNKHYAVVFMDMQMPEIDGVEATRLIRVMDELPQPHIIAMTANALEADRKQCLEAGMNGFVAKPIRLEDVRSALASLNMDDLARTVVDADPPPLASGD